MENHIDLLETKFSINHIYRQKAITRENLFCILNDAVNTRLTLISAPAGFGKTTLLSSWITMHKKRSITAAWLTLEAEDNEENRFWIYFISAIKSIIPDIGEKSLNLLYTSRIGGIETIITVLINEILENRKKFLFIIEDLHVIKNTQILNGLKFFINHMPCNIHLIITSRLRIITRLSGIKHFNSIIEIFFGKKAILLSSTGGSGLKGTLNYMKMTAIGWGFDIAGMVGVCGSSLSSDEKYKADVQIRIDKLVDKIYKNRKAGQPSLYQLAMFRAMQCKALKSAQKKNIEYNYWLERGWLEKNYYTSQKIGIAKRFYSYFLKHIMRKMMNGKNIIIN